MVDIKKPSNRRWVWFLTALIILPLVGLYHILRKENNNGVMERGPLTAELLSGEPGTAAAPGSTPSVHSAGTSVIGTETFSENPGEASAWEPSGTGNPEPFPRQLSGGVADRSQGGQTAVVISGEAAPDWTDKSSADTKRSQFPGPGTSADKNTGARPITPARPSQTRVKGGQTGTSGLNSAADIKKTLALGKINLGEHFMKALLNRQPGAMLFDTKQIIAAGGRAGQGSISMENNSKVTLDNFDPSAKGFSSLAGTEPPGPKIPAGKAPALPSSHLPYILQAAQSAGVDPALVAATAARESNFRYGAYRAEPHLKQVTWRAAPGSTAGSYCDGSIGPMQVLRSNFLSRNIGSDAQANDLATNYRIGAQIIRGDQNAFPGDMWKAVASYNVGIHGASIGRIPAGNYTDTILQWRKEYAKAIAPYR